VRYAKFEGGDGGTVWVFFVDMLEKFVVTQLKLDDLNMVAF
jgi:hypothetical protein